MLHIILRRGMSLPTEKIQFSGCEIPEFDESSASGAGTGW
jgi:hypothetical protein